MLEKKKNKLFFERAGYFLLILFTLYFLVINTLFFYTQYLGAFIIVFDPYINTFDEVHFSIFLVQALFFLYLMTKFIYGLIKSYRKQRVFSEAEINVKSGNKRKSSWAK